MAATVQLIRKEIIGRELEFVATVISDPQLINFDTSAAGAPVWVVDLEIGGTRPVVNVPIKASGSGARFYAQLGQTVKVRRTALGRMYVVGPGDTTIGTKVTTEYELDSGDIDVVVNLGFSNQKLPYEFYQGPQSMKGFPDLDFAVTGGDDTITRLDAGDFTADGLAAGQTVRIFGSSLNDADVLLTTVTALVLSTSDTLVAETGATKVTIMVPGTAIWNDGSTFYPFFRLLDGDGNPVV